MRFRCRICAGGFSSFKYNRLLRHYEKFHVNFKVACGINGCRKKLSNVRAIKNHLKRYHPLFFTCFRPP